jgi:hypothetical protein
MLVASLDVSLVCINERVESKRFLRLCWQRTTERHRYVMGLARTLPGFVQACHAAKACKHIWSHDWGGESGKEQRVAARRRGGSIRGYLIEW